MSLLRAFGHNVIVELLPPKTQHSSLIIIPTSYQKESGQGIVRQIGVNVKYIKVGDHVIFNQQWGEQILSKGREYNLIHEKHLTFTISTQPTIIPGLFHLSGTYVDDDGADQPNYIEATDESLFEAIMEQYALENKRLKVEDLKDHDANDVFDEEDEDAD